MTRFRRVRLRTRLALALGAVALVSVALATVLANRGLEQRLGEYARTRLTTSARHSAMLAERSYRRQSGWDARAIEDLQHITRINGFRLTLRDARGRLLTSPGPAGGVERSSAPVIAGGRRVGTLTITPLRGEVLTGEDRALRTSLDRLHMLAGLLGLIVGLAAAVALATSLSRPLRRLTGEARRIEDGDPAGVGPIRGGGREIEELALALDRLSDSLRRQEKTRRETVADVAHELRTPVTGLLSRIEAAQDGVLEDDRSNLEQMHAEALRLTRVLDDIGRLAEAERPGLLVAKRPIDLAEIALLGGRRFADRFDAKGIKLHQNLAPARARGDTVRLEQVVDNLLANAIRYTDGGGEVALGTHTGGGEVVLEVADTGIGIPPKDLPHVFERFWRGEKSRSRATGGAGIGLAIVKELVHAHDGRIAIDSEPGRGTRVRVTLPRDRWAGPSEQGANAGASRRTRPRATRGTV